MRTTELRAALYRSIRGTALERRLNPIRLGRVLRRRAGRPDVKIGPVRVLNKAFKGPLPIAEVTRLGRTTVVSTKLDADWDGVRYTVARNNLPVVIHLLAQAAPSVRSVSVDFGDADVRGTNDRLAFCASSPGCILIPDPDFFTTDSYRSERLELVRQRSWRDRADTIAWRGGTTGRGKYPDEGTDMTGADVLPRIRMCAILKSVAGVDAKIHDSVQATEPERLKQALLAAGLFGDAIPRNAWLDHKFAIDIDGNANAWSNLFTRLLFGCCVLKVQSPRNYRQWYYDRIEPWAHYIPVHSDLADLVERIEWCRSHQNECAEVATAGQALALSMTRPSEIREAVRRINERLG